MAREAQIEANRANAQKSTGPKTSEGKAVVSQNAVRHGLLAEQVVIKGQDPGEFEFYREALIGELAQSIVEIGAPVRYSGQADAGATARTDSWQIKEVYRAENKTCPDKCVSDHPRGRDLGAGGAGRRREATDHRLRGSSGRL